MDRPLVVATSRRWPEPSASDRLYLAALERRGIETRHAAWNESPEPFLTAGAVVLRSTWDYHHDLPGFRDWLDLLELTGVPVFNSPSLVRWNLDKRYLLELENRGIPVPRTVVAPEDPAELDTIFDLYGWNDAVVKPAWGASGFGVQRLCRDAAAELLDSPDHDGRPLLIQELLPEVSLGEVSAIFFDGVFSHAVRKTPAPGEFRVNSQYGGENQLTELPDAVLSGAVEVLEALPEQPLYARIDGVVRDGRFVVMEVELHEPGLWLHLAPDSADRFAEATLQRLESHR